MTTSRNTDLELGQLRYDFSREEISEIFNLPVPRLMRIAQNIHSRFFADDEIEFATLLSVKTGGCKEDCGYCSQSAKHGANVDAHQLMSDDDIMKAALSAKAKGSTRFCMGAAWSSPPKKGQQFNLLLESVRKVADLGLEVCTTLGMLDVEQATQLKEAGVHSYNHNIDTSPEFYDKVISTRTFEDRLNTIKNVRKAGMRVCCGGIIGLGEGREDRYSMLEQLSKMQPHPESVPINLLMKMDGTPLSGAGDIDIFELVRTIATARIIMPTSRVRLSAGRSEMSDEAQALCFTAGANSIFSGEKLLTADNPGLDSDKHLMMRLGMKPVAKKKDPLKTKLVPNQPMEHSTTLQ